MVLGILAGGVTPVSASKTGARAEWRILPPTARGIKGDRVWEKKPVCFKGSPKARIKEAVTSPTFNILRDSGPSAWHLYALDWKKKGRPGEDSLADF